MRKAGKRRKTKTNKSQVISNDSPSCVTHVGFKSFMILFKYSKRTTKVAVRKETETPAANIQSRQTKTNDGDNDAKAGNSCRKRKVANPTAPIKNCTSDTLAPSTGLAEHQQSAPRSFYRLASPQSIAATKLTKKQYLSN